MLETVASPAAPLPPLKWAGGKRWQVPRLRDIWEPHKHRRLVEPFCGGLSVALGLRPKRALLNDSNPNLISFYKWLKRGLEVDINLKKDERVYYRHRTRFNSLISTGESESREAAALFYYLNRTGYNGLCRFNRKGEFNVPFGRHKKITYIRDFTSYSPVLSKWDFTNEDFADLAIRSDDFVYADPPYDVEFTQYAKDGFSWEDQCRTAQFLSKLKGPVVLVNQATRRIETLYRDSGFEVDFLEAPRRISCNGDRTPAREIIGTRNL